MNSDRGQRRKGRAIPQRRTIGGLYKEYGTHVYAIAMSILRDHQRAEDAAQETWCRVLDALEREVDIDSPKGWLGTIAWREARRIARRKDTTIFALVNEPTAVMESPAAAAERVEIRDALSQIPEDDRDLLVHRYLEGWSPKELRKKYGFTSAKLWDRTESACRRLYNVVRQRNGGRE
ncbi:MAG: sigma-70 family RNA polymerase sigma factor [Acidobacteria bacterium]|nr:sigma-70 family RNA polymerase sigma factor [Acidobacteriota bacterium]